MAVDVKRVILILGKDNAIFVEAIEEAIHPKGVCSRAKTTDEAMELIGGETWRNTSVVVIDHTSLGDQQNPSQRLLTLKTFVVEGRSRRKIIGVGMDHAELLTLGCDIVSYGTDLPQLVKSALGINSNGR